MRHLTVLSSKGQVVIAADIRRHMHWRAGTPLLIQRSPASSRLVLTPASRPKTTTPLPTAGILRNIYPASAQYVQDLRQEADRDADR